MPAAQTVVSRSLRRCSSFTSTSAIVHHLLVTPSDEVLAAHHALIRSDNAFQRVARLRQARWRERQNLPVGEHRGRPLGSRLAMPFAQNTLANFMTDTVRDVVRVEVLDPLRSEGKLYRAPRIFEDLLSSQPLCFNLFAELQRDLMAAGRVFERLLGRPDLRVVSVDFEHSPGRGDARFTGDHSAFDVFVTCEAGSELGFVGIEVKYVENLEQPVARHRSRYDEVAENMGAFRTVDRERLGRAPLEQFWRDHLLAGSLVLEPTAGFAWGTFAVIWPSENVVVGEAVCAYETCLVDRSTFRSWTLESVLDAVDSLGALPWARAVRERYLGEAREPDR